jgi:hypothetical protein
VNDLANNGWPALLAVAIIVAALLVLVLLFSVLQLRGRVAQAIREEGFTPVRVRWRPFAYWAPRWCFRGHPFEAVYADASGLTQSGRFWVSQWPGRVRWIAPQAGYLEKPMTRVARAVYFSAAALCVGFATTLLLAQQVYVPRLAYWSGGRYLRGWPKDLLALAALCAAGSLLAQVAYHYSRQTDERRHRWAARAFSAAAWALFWISWALALCSR